MKYKPFQKHDYARLALARGGILAHEPGLGKTWAAYSWAFLKVGFTHTPGSTRVPRVTPNAPVLIVEPGDLHQQFVDEGTRVFKTRVTPLDSQETFLRLSHLDKSGRRILPPGFYITSYTQLGLNGTSHFPDPLKNPHGALSFLGCTIEDVKKMVAAGSIAADPNGYYKILGVPRCATSKEIQGAYRSLCKKFHPDISPAPDAEAMMKRINAAFEILGDTEARAAYDRSAPVSGARALAGAARTPSRPASCRAASPELALVKARRTWDELTTDEQTDYIREFCFTKIQDYSLNLGAWGDKLPAGEHGLPARSGRHPAGHLASAARTFPARCVLTPSLADLCQDSFAAVIVDEATRMKAGFNTYIATGVLQLNAPYRLVLTATPIKNRVPDAFWLVWWACGANKEGHARFPYGVGDKESFAETFCVSERNLTLEQKEKRRSAERKEKKRTYLYQKLTPQVCNVHKIWKLMAPSILRRRKKDIGEQIVPKIRHLVRCSMGTAQAALYKEALDWNPLDKNGKPATGVKLQALRMIAAAPHSPLVPIGRGPAYVPKVAITLTIVEQVLRRGEQIIIFSPFHDPLDYLSTLLAQCGVRHAVLDGRTGQKERGRQAAIFKLGPPTQHVSRTTQHIPVLLASNECMAEGHSFHLCNNMLQFAYPWALDKVLQSEDRAHRLNSVKPVNTYRLICDGSIDRKMESQCDEKSDSAELVLDGHLLGEQRHELNMAELLDLAAKEFDDMTQTVDERVLQTELPAIQKRLAEAYANWQGASRTGDEGSAAILAAQADILSAPVPVQTPAPATSAPALTGWRARWQERRRLQAA